MAVITPGLINNDGITTAMIEDASVTQPKLGSLINVSHFVNDSGYIAESDPVLDLNTVNADTLNSVGSHLTLNSTVTGTPTLDAGITVERGTDSDTKIQWNETDELWETLVGASAASLRVNTIIASNINGPQSNVTTVNAVTVNATTVNATTVDYGNTTQIDDKIETTANYTVRANSGWAFIESPLVYTGTNATYLTFNLNKISAAGTTTVVEFDSVIKLDNLAVEPTGTAGDTYFKDRKSVV